MKRPSPGLTSAVRQRGVALLVVLWACTLLAILLGGYAALAHTEAVQARYQFEQTQAHYAAEAGLARAVAGLQDGNLAQRWIADGRPYRFDFSGAAVTVSVQDEGGKVDLNAASAEVLQRLFIAAGLPEARATEQARAVLEWRSYPNSPEEAQRRAAVCRRHGLNYGPRNGPFASIEELQMVLGMDGDLYNLLAPQLTLWSGRENPDPMTAPPLALAALPGMDAERMRQVLAARAQRAGRLVPETGLTHSIRSEATLADGTRAVLRATIRLQGMRAVGQPYAVMRWREGEAE